MYTLHSYNSIFKLCISWLGYKMFMIIDLAICITQDLKDLIDLVILRGIL